MNRTAAWELEMTHVTANVQKAITAGRHAGLSAEAATLAAFIAALTATRLEGLPEEHLIREAQKAVPQSMASLSRA